MTKRTAIVFGATGLVGSYLVKLLCESDSYAIVVSFSRRPCGFIHPKLNERISDLKNTNVLAGEIAGDDLFCCLGTTIKTAGSKENFRKVDFDLPVDLATIAARNKMQSFSVISSVGANAKSSNFYLRTKGQMEEDVMQSSIPKIVIVRPSMILGPRQEFRFGEVAGKVLMKLINPMMLGKYKKYRGIHAETVAMAILAITENVNTGAQIYESDELQMIAQNYQSG